MPRLARPARIALVVLLPVVVAAAAYGGYWFYVAGQVRAAIADWASARRAEGITVGWDSYVVKGFPGKLRVTIEGPVYANSTATPGYEARGARLTGEAWPWAFRDWRLEAPEGGRIVVQPGPERAAVTVAAARLAGSVTVPSNAADPASSGTAVALAGERITIAGDFAVTVARASIQAILPGRSVGHQEIWSSATIAADEIVLPNPVEPLGKTIAHIDGGLVVKGTIPPGPRPAALQAWRDDGGTLELQYFSIGWGKLALAATGTLSLDQDMQPLGALTARIGGYNEIIDAMVAAKTMRAGDAQFAKIGLGLLAKPGSDGGQVIDAPITLQNGQLFIGPAKLSRLPHFTWE